MNLDKLIESFLIEAALTKGSQRVMADKKLVAALAATVRDDAAINPEAFPPGSKNNFKKATDEAVAQWFLENIDQIEREGYEGTVYSRDGVNNDWIVRRYIAGSHTWEDLTGVMNMNLRDWYLLKNRNMLDPNHKDLAKFKSVRDVGYYMTTHYKDELEKVRDAAKNAARNKMAKNFKLVDNDDYRIYTAINRAAGCALGLGTQWCTANSNYAGHYHRYAGNAMLFQLFPYVTKKNAETGEEELGLSETSKYQFDAGGPTFMDITDTPVPAAKVRETFPYIFTDLATALKKNKSKMEKAFEEWANDPTLQHEDFKIKTYEIDEEIQKLHKFVDRGYFTDEKRPSETSADDATGEQPQIGAAPAQEQPPQEPQMESLKDLARAMLEDKTLGHFVQQYKPLNKSGEESPMTRGGDNLDETNIDECGLGQAKQGLIAALAARAGQGQQPMDEEGINTQPADSRVIRFLVKRLKNSMGEMAFDDWVDEAIDFTIEKFPGVTYDQLRNDPRVLEYIEGEGDEPVYEDDPSMMGQEDPGAQVATGGTLGGGGGGAGGGQYPPGTAPTMPESIQSKEIAMENVDKDVAAMLKSLKTYDKLNESALGMLTLSMAKPKVVEAGKPWEDAEEEEKDNKEEVEEDVEVKHIPYKEPRKSEKTNYGSKHIGSATGQGSRGQQRGANANVSTGKKTGDKTALPVVKEDGPDKSSVPAAFRKEKGGDWKTSKADLDKEASKSPTTKKGLEDLKAKKDVKESTGADQEVLDWMNRFSKLGNMKGYGR